MEKSSGWPSAIGGRSSGYSGCHLSQRARPSMIHGGKHRLTDHFANHKDTEGKIRDLVSLDLQGDTNMEGDSFGPLGGARLRLDILG